MTLQLHKPDGEGGLEPTPVEPDWRAQLRSPRWGSGLERDRLPDLKNPEMNPTSRFQSVLFWLALGFVTFAILVLGYASGFWSLKKPVQDPSPAPSAIVVGDHVGSGPLQSRVGTWRLWTDA